MNTDYCFEFHKTRTMNFILSHFLATGIQQKRRDNVDLLEELLGMPSMREIEALSRPPPPQQPEPFTFQPLIFRSFQRFAEDRHRTLVVGRFRHLLQFLVLLLLRRHLHPAINIIRLEYSGCGD